MTQAILLAFTVLLIIAAVGDWQRFLIPNWISLAILALYPPFVLSSHFLSSPPVAVPWLASLGVATIIFVILAGLFALNKLGGGDVKMISAVSLWAGPGLLAGFLIITSLAGGVLAVVTLLRSRLEKMPETPKPDEVTSATEEANPENRDKESDAAEDAEMPSLPIPYGVAIACGGFFVSGKHIINQFSQ